MKKPENNICDLATAHGYGLISAFSNTSKEDWETNDEWFREYRSSITFGNLVGKALAHDTVING